jgi:hypothetical protein
MSDVDSYFIEIRSAESTSKSVPTMFVLSFE